MATTAIGTLIPILRDNGELKTRFGTYLLAAGGAGEFGPILLVTLFLSTDHPLHEALILLAFVAPRPRPRARSRCARLARLAGAGADLRGEQPAGGADHRRARLRPRPPRRQARPRRPARRLRRRADHPPRAARATSCTVFESKLTAVGFGFFVPFFFVISGIDFDLAALGSLGAILKLLMFFALFLVVRGVPAMLLYRDVLRRPRPRRPRLLLRDRAAAGGRDHDDRGRSRPHGDLDRRRPGRRRDALDPDLPLRRPGPAPRPLPQKRTASPDEDPPRLARRPRAAPSG